MNVSLESLRAVPVTQQVRRVTPGLAQAVLCRGMPPTPMHGTAWAWAWDACRKNEERHRILATVKAWW